jgi:antitoxin (DNA-binding transcriptional repressor) of toxin-antitoxin stability system
MKTIASTSARRAWSRMLGRVEHRGQRFAIVRNGRLIAALIPYDEVAILGQIEDELDFQEAREAIALERGKQRLDWDELMRFAELAE